MPELSMLAELAKACPTPLRVPMRLLRDLLGALTFRGGFSADLLNTGRI